jgi:hypothetical protein
VIQPRALPQQHPRAGNPRVARAASERRVVRKSRARYTDVVRAGRVIGILLVAFMSYVLLTSRLTGLSYAVASAERQKEVVQLESMRLDDKIAALRSDDRLSTLAARLGMRDPERFAVVHLPQVRPEVDRSHVAMLSSLAGMFLPQVGRSR